jgi:hypothetical protein
VAHYRPWLLSPLFPENVATRPWNRGGHRYTTSLYDVEPLAREGDDNRVTEHGLRAKVVA